MRDSDRQAMQAHYVVQGTATRRQYDYISDSTCVTRSSTSGSGSEMPPVLATPVPSGFAKMLRSMQRFPDCVPALIDELRLAIGSDLRYGAAYSTMRSTGRPPLFARGR